MLHCLFGTVPIIDRDHGNPRAGFHGQENNGWKLTKATGLNPAAVVPHFGYGPDDAFDTTGNQCVQNLLMSISWMTYQAEKHGITQFIRLLLDPHYGA